MGATAPCAKWAEGMSRTRVAQWRPMWSGLRGSQENQFQNTLSHVTSNLAWIHRTYMNKEGDHNLQLSSSRSRTESQWGGVGDIWKEKRVQKDTSALSQNLFWSTTI
uniref:Uncharacterized protein n=1 Tax=Oryza brachyantha TaxID=4533 RepID=J3MGJ6_ORYBR